ncbi:hypothetical protein Tco_0831985 [Tanacetum coccineum]
MFKLIRSDSLNSAAGAILLKESAQDVLKLLKQIKFVIQEQAQFNPISTSIKAVEELLGYLWQCSFLSTMSLPTDESLFQAIKTIFKAITTRSGISYDGLPIPPPSSSLPKVVEREPEVTKDTVLPSTENIQPPVVQIQALIDEPVTFSYNTIESVNRVDVIDVACEEYAQEVLGFSNIFKSGNPTPTLELILSTSPTSLTPFEGGDFILEEIEACLTSKSIPPGIDDADFDLKEDLLTLEKLLNSDPTSTLPPEEQKIEELKTVKPSRDDLPELELKDIPPHLEYAFLEGTDKLPVIIAKDLKDEDKTALLKVLRSHKCAIAWKMSDINGIDPKFCTHKILWKIMLDPRCNNKDGLTQKFTRLSRKKLSNFLKPD